MPTRSVQVFPGGQCYTIKSAADGHAVDHNGLYLIADNRGRGADDFRAPTAEERRAVAIQIDAERIREAGVLCLDSCLVSELLNPGEPLPESLAGEFTIDKITNQSIDCEDWTLAQCVEWLEDEGHDLPDPNPATMDRGELLEALDLTPGEDDTGDTLPETEATATITDDDLRGMVSQAIDDETNDGIDDYREAVTDNWTPGDIFEWYRVDSWLAGKLDEVGEAVLDNDYGTWWGRTCTGQDNIMDGTFQKVAESLLAFHESLSPAVFAG
jgi:hypothetical protein